jgi:hypothetical protein
LDLTFDATIKLNEDTVEECATDSNSRACVRGEDYRNARLAWNDEKEYYAQDEATRQSFDE